MRGAAAKNQDGMFPGDESMNESDDQRTRLDAEGALAERELRAFIAAVLRLYGEDQARLAGNDWLRLMIGTSAIAPPKGFRQITVAAAIELGRRLASSAAPTALTLE